MENHTRVAAWGRGQAGKEVEQYYDTQKSPMESSCVNKDAPES
jgi:hypothetical protein